MERNINAQKDKRLFIVNPNYCKKYGVSKQTARNTATKMLLDMQLQKLYNINLSVKENLEALKKMGVRIGKSSLYNWVKTQFV